MKLKFYYYYSIATYNLCRAVHKLYRILDREHARASRKIRKELQK